MAHASTRAFRFLSALTNHKSRNGSFRTQNAEGRGLVWTARLAEGLVVQNIRGWKWWAAPSYCKSRCVFPFGFQAPKRSCIVDGMRCANSKLSSFLTEINHGEAASNVLSEFSQEQRSCFIKELRVCDTLFWLHTLGVPCARPLCCFSHRQAVSWRMSEPLRSRE